MDRELKLIDGHDKEMALIRRHLYSKGTRIVEAGCGGRWHPLLANPDAELTGVDTDAIALARRTDLNRSIVGDIATVALPAASADAVYCAFVLEHVKGAEQALENFLNWLRPGGVAIIRVPDRYSATGFVTRVTPHWFHVLYYRWQGVKTAGKPGFGPYPTLHEPIISLKGLRQFSAKHGCTILEEYGRASYLQYGHFAFIKKLVAICIWVMSFGKFKWRHNDIGFIFSTPESTTHTVAQSAS